MLFLNSNRSERIHVFDASHFSMIEMRLRKLRIYVFLCNFYFIHWTRSMIIICIRSMYLGLNPANTWQYPKIFVPSLFFGLFCFRFCVCVCTNSKMCSIDVSCDYYLYLYSTTVNHRSEMWWLLLNDLWLTFVQHMRSNISKYHVWRFWDTILAFIFL